MLSSAHVGFTCEFIVPVGGDPNDVYSCDLSAAIPLEVEIYHIYMSISEQRQGRLDCRSKEYAITHNPL